MYLHVGGILRHHVHLLLLHHGLLHHMLHRWGQKLRLPDRCTVYHFRGLTLEYRFGWWARDLLDEGTSLLIIEQYWYGLLYKRLLIISVFFNAARFADFWSFSFGHFIK